MIRFIHPHALLRCITRTAMMPRDVRALIRAEAMMSLGNSAGFEYLLFYSVPDRKYKIAVVKDSFKLLSIWEQNYRLPTGIRRPTETLRKVAAERSEAWFAKNRPLPPDASFEAAP